MKATAQQHLRSLFLSSVFAIGIALCLNAQDSGINDFMGLKSEGPIPEHFTTLSYEKYLEQSKNIDRNGKTQFDKKTQKTFYQNSNYWIDELMLSGKILFNDPVSEYLNDIADVLLNDEPALRKELKFYAAKSEIYNAVSTDQGILFVNTGLIARMNSEAQIAFVMAHEIAHYAEKHNLNSYLESQRIRHSKGVYKKADMENKILNINHMSKEDEMEADKIGYKRFYKNSGYKLSEIDSIFHSMLLSESPFKEVDFELSFFEDEYYKFPQKYVLDTLKEIDIEQLQKEEEEFVKESEDAHHPATSERSLALRRMKLKENDDNNKAYIVSEERFAAIKQLCQFETLKQQMLSRNYIDVVYNAYALLQDYPNNKFLEITLASALYQISHKKTSNENSVKLEEEYALPGSEHGVQIQRVQFLFDELNEAEATVLATKYLLNVIEKHGPSEHTTAMLNDLMADLFIQNSLKLDELLTAAELVTDISLNDPNQPNNDLYYLNAFANELDNNDQTAREFEEWDKKRKLKEKEEEEFEQLSAKEKSQIKREERKQEKDHDKRLKYRGASMDIDKVVVVDPNYLKLSNKKNQLLNLKKTELNKIRYGKRIEECITKSDIRAEILDSKNISTTSIKQFNNMALLNEWMSERVEYNFDYNFVPYSGYFMTDVLDEFNTDHFLWTGVLAEKKKKSVMLAIGASVLLTYGTTLPFVLVWAMIPSYQTYYYSVLFDLKNGNSELLIFSSFKGSDLSGDFVKSSVYDTFQQINK